MFLTKEKFSKNEEIYLNETLKLNSKNFEVFISEKDKNKGIYYPCYRQPHELRTWRNNGN